MFSLGWSPPLSSWDYRCGLLRPVTWAFSKQMWHGRCGTSTWTEKGILRKQKDTECEGNASQEIDKHYLIKCPEVWRHGSSGRSHFSFFFFLFFWLYWGLNSRPCTLHLPGSHVFYHLSHTSSNRSCAQQTWSPKFKSHYNTPSPPKKVHQMCC
jgi:hypothetical protein